MCSLSALRCLAAAPSCFVLDTTQYKHTNTHTNSAAATPFSCVLMAVCLAFFVFDNAAARHAETAGICHTPAPAHPFNGQSFRWECLKRAVLRGWFSGTSLRTGNLKIRQTGREPWRHIYVTRTSYTPQDKNQHHPSGFVSSCGSQSVHRSADWIHPPCRRRHRQGRHHQGRHIHKHQDNKTYVPVKQYRMKSCCSEQRPVLSSLNWRGQALPMS